MKALILIALLPFCLTLQAKSDPPAWNETAKVARWIVHNANTGVVGTINHVTGYPFVMI